MDDNALLLRAPIRHPKGIPMTRAFYGIALMAICIGSLVAFQADWDWRWLILTGLCYGVLAHG